MVQFSVKWTRLKTGTSRYRSFFQEYTCPSQRRFSKLKNSIYLFSCQLPLKPRQISRCNGESLREHEYNMNIYQLFQPWVVCLPGLEVIHCLRIMNNAVCNFWIMLSWIFLVRWMEILIHEIPVFFVRSFVLPLSSLHEISVSSVLSLALFLFLMCMRIRNRGVNSYKIYLLTMYIVQCTHCSGFIRTSHVQRRGKNGFRFLDVNVISVSRLHALYAMHGVQCAIVHFQFATKCNIHVHQILIILWSKYPVAFYRITLYIT